MNERIQQLAEQAKIEFTYDPTETPMRAFAECWEDDLEKFAELIVRECKENFAKVWYEQGMDIRGAEIGKFLTRFNEHFGVEE